MVQNQNNFNQHPTPEVSFIELNTEPWDQRMEDLIEDQASIITLRGAGTVNGIDPTRVDMAVSLIQEHVIRLKEENGKVALIYDGDADNREFPDIGSVFGNVADIFAGDPAVVTIAAQKHSWYVPEVPNSPLTSAIGTPYETYVFSDNLKGKHATLTQSQKLVNYPNYEQIFVGPVGDTGLSQIEDLSKKSLARPKRAGDLMVRIISTNNNQAVDEELFSKLRDPNLSHDNADKIERNLMQRANFPRGYLFSISGERLNVSNLYPGVRYEWFDL